jgi:glucose/mannose transport system permease protein
LSKIEYSAVADKMSFWKRKRWVVPLFVIAPSLIASFVYVFVFTGWTMYISLSNSTLLPSYDLSGWKNYTDLWSDRAWGVAYRNLLFFSFFYVILTAVVGLFLAVLLDQKIRAEGFWLAIFLYPLAISFIVTGTIWQWIYNPSTGIEAFVRSLGWADFSFGWISNRKMAIWVVIITGVWQAAGFAMALFLAGLRSVDQDLVKAAAVDGASTFRTYRKVVFPAMGPIFIAVFVVLLQFAIKTFDLVIALTNSGPGIATTFPATIVYELMFQRGLIAKGAAASIMVLAALAIVLVPYSLYLVWRRKREASNG